MPENFIGPIINDNKASFRVWAPFAERVHIVFVKNGIRMALQKEEHGYHSIYDVEVLPGTHYMYTLDDGPLRPDPVSHYQPEGVHGPSELVYHPFPLPHDGWTPPGLRDSVLYELHTGTFTQSGTFEGLLTHLDYLKDLGVTTLQLMPIAQFPGNRNWGYDGVQLFAPQNSYGGPRGLRALIDACHKKDLAVYLDVVYNHLGPEGNYLGEFGPYFTDHYRSPWGASVNLDGPYSDAVRHFFIQNAIYWLDIYQFDGLRLDATHALFDFSARPFLAELSDRVHEWATKANRHITLIAENDQSDRRLTLPTRTHGLGMNGQWLDDLHHTLHVSLTGEDRGYYLDYQAPELLPKVLCEGFAYTGEYSPARKRTHGTSVSDLSTERFIVSTQTHDQVGNRMKGERLSDLTSFDGLKLAACLLISSPYTPMLFMGEEYGEHAPFLYFISHTDPNLVAAVREGRAKEFAEFEWGESPPDPQAESTFLSCKLDHTLYTSGDYRILYHLYKTLLQLRRTVKAFTNPVRADNQVYLGSTPRMICLERKSEDEVIRVLMNFETQNASHFSFSSGTYSWHKIIDSQAKDWSPDAELSTSSLPEHIPANHVKNLLLAPVNFAIYKTENLP